MTPSAFIQGLLMATKNTLRDSPYPAMNQPVTVPRIPYANAMPEGMVLRPNMTTVPDATSSSEFVNHGYHLETLLPYLMNNAQTLNQYARTGQHLGKFKTPDDATAFAQLLGSMR